MGGMGGASEVVDQVLLGGATEHYGDTAGLHDAGQASDWDLIKAGGNWGGRLGQAAATVYAPGRTAVGVAQRGIPMGGMVTRWGPPGRYVMVGGPNRASHVLGGVPELGHALDDAVTWTVPRGALRYPIPEQGRFFGTIKGLIGQRVLK